jgi:pentatricopeptide repeat protein
MDAYAMRKDVANVEAVFRQQEKRYEETTDEAVRPTVNGYNKLIKAYGIVGDLEKATSIFRSLLEHDDDDDPLKANDKSWVLIMKAYMNDDRKKSIDTVESLFREMSQTYRGTGGAEYEPGVEPYNVLIRAVGKRNSNGPQEAEAILFEMIERFRNGEENLKPNVETFRNVLSAYANTRNKKYSPSVVAKMDRLIQIQEGFLSVNSNSNDDGDDDDTQYGQPDGRLYSAALNVIARSTDPRKATKARQLVERFQKNSGGSEYMNGLYRSVLSACAYTDGTPEEKFEAFQIALGVLKELRTRPDLKLNSSSAGLFLKACANLMPQGPKRDELVKGVFEDCCNRGIVNEFVVDALGGVSSDKLQLELVGGIICYGVRIRKEWSRNVA